MFFYDFLGEISIFEGFSYGFPHVFLGFECTGFPMLSAQGGVAPVINGLSSHELVRYITKNNHTEIGLNCSPTERDLELEHHPAGCLPGSFRSFRWPWPGRDLAAPTPATAPHRRSLQRTARRWSSGTTQGRGQPREGQMLRGIYDYVYVYLYVYDCVYDCVYVDVYVYDTRPMH